MTAALVPIGNGLYLTPHTAALWRAAGSPALYDYRSAWRSQAVQQRLRDDYLRDPAHHPYAAPLGRSNHEKGAAFDLKYPTAAARRRCIAAGLIPDGSEDWHFNDPTAARMPVIRSLASATGGTAQLIGDDDMPRMIHKDKPRRIVLVAGDSTLALGQATANALVPAYGLSKLVPAATLDAVERCAELMGKANAEEAADAISAEFLAKIADPAE
jgi:hypothetical protein